MSKFATAEKIILNHYCVKSKEEFVERKMKANSNPDVYSSSRQWDYFEEHDRNDVFDDEILRYRAVREKTLGGGVETLLQRKKIDYPRILNSLLQNLLPTINRETPPQFFAGKMETFLTCRAVANHLTAIKILDERDGKFFEELALRAIHKTLSTGMTFADAQLLISEIPTLLTLNYPAVNDIRGVLIKIIQQMTEILRLSITGIPMFHLWRDIVELENILNLLKAFDNYNHK